MNNNNLLLYGAIAVGAIFLYNRYTKKPQGQEEQGGGGGVGPIGPMPPLPPIAPILNINQGRSYTASEVTKSKNTTPTPASTSSTSVGAMSGVGISNTGGIVPIGQGGSTTPKFSTGSVSQSQMSSGLSGGLVFKPFDGDMGGLRLENLVRSWNRP
jgi:hypothetical protein